MIRILSTVAMLLFFSLSSHANRSLTKADTTRFTHTVETDSAPGALPAIYRKGVIVSSPWKNNWFLEVAGGTNAFLGTPLGCADLFGRMKPAIRISAGKWFLPQLGMRIGYDGPVFKDAQLEKRHYHHLHADLLWNVLGSLYRQEKPLAWSLSPFIGAGMMYNKSIGEKTFAFSYGLQGQYRITRKTSLIMECSNSTTLQQFDGMSKHGGFGDNMMSLSAGFSFRIGKDGWERPIDPLPYIRQNEYLSGYTRKLQEENADLEHRHETDRQTLLQLKKILEIEGLLDTYKEMFSRTDDCFRKEFPKNNYSGLNSLRARLRNRQWNTGKEKEPHTSPTAGGNIRWTDSLQRPTNGSAVIDSIDMEEFEKNMVGAPIYFFFKLGTSRLTDPSQELNIDELARVAKKHGLYLTVIGAADNTTGTREINNRLSAERSEYICRLLAEKGVDKSHIEKRKKGGVSEHSPAETNRYTKVILHTHK